MLAQKTRNPDFTAPKTTGFVPDFASTMGHSIPDPDDPETRFTRKNPGSRPENRVFFYTVCEVPLVPPPAGIVFSLYALPAQVPPPTGIVFCLWALPFSYLQNTSMFFSSWSRSWS